MPEETLTFTTTGSSSANVPKEGGFVLSENQQAALSDLGTSLHLLGNLLEGLDGADAKHFQTGAMCRTLGRAAEAISAPAWSAYIVPKKDLK